MGEVLLFPNPTELAERARVAEVDQNRHQEEIIDVLHLYNSREADGTYPEQVLNDVLTNTITDGYEAAVPNGVASTEQIYWGDDYYWMGQSSVDVARSGYKHHKLPFALMRVDEEIEEAIDSRDNLKPGWAKITLSPRASSADATLAEAKAEKLSDCDMVRIQYLKNGPNGETIKKIESIRVFDVPLDAWAKLLHDPNNMFGRSIELDDSDSALSVLKTHSQTYVPLSRLPNGPVSVFEAVMPYISDSKPLVSAQNQLERFHEDQDELRRNVEHIAQERLKMQVELAESLHNKIASKYVQYWLDAYEDKLKGQAPLLIKMNRRTDGKLTMDEELELALLASKINKSILWAKAGIVTGNDDILKAVSTELVTIVRREHTFAMNNDLSWEQRQAQQEASNFQIAMANLKVGGACSGTIEDMFGQDKTDSLKSSLESLFGEQEYDFDQEMYCVACQAPPKMGAKKKMCGPCGICEPCDVKLRAKEASVLKAA